MPLSVLHPSKTFLVTSNWMFVCLECWYFNKHKKVRIEKKFYIPGQF